MVLYYVNRSGGQTSIRVPDVIVQRYNLKPGVIDSHTFRRLMYRVGCPDLARFVRGAQQDRCWVALRTEEEHNRDVVARYT